MIPVPNIPFKKYSQIFLKNDPNPKYCLFSWNGSLNDDDDDYYDNEEDGENTQEENPAEPVTHSHGVLPSPKLVAPSWEKFHN